MRQARQAGIAADMDHAARSLKAQFKYAGKLGVPLVAVIAGDELAQGVVRLRDMTRGEEQLAPREAVVEKLRMDK